jgi:hypothetical protein
MTGSSLESIVRASPCYTTEHLHLPQSKGIGSGKFANHPGEYSYSRWRICIDCIWSRIPPESPVQFALSSSRLPQAYGKATSLRSLCSDALELDLARETPCTMKVVSVQLRTVSSFTQRQDLTKNAYPSIEGEPWEKRTPREGPNPMRIEIGQSWSKWVVPGGRTQYAAGLAGNPPTASAPFAETRLVRRLQTTCWISALAQSFRLDPLVSELHQTLKCCTPQTLAGHSAKTRFL